MTLPQPPAISTDFALFLDLDGTLIPIKPVPDWVRLDQDRLDVLQDRLAQQNGAMAFVSGRAMDGMIGMLGDINAPLSAMHGIELRLNGKTQSAANLPDLGPIRDLIVPEVKRLDLLLEDKGAAMALHYRQHPELADVATKLAEKCAALVPGVVALHGNMVFEIKPSALSKGSAVVEIMQLPEFVGKIPVFVGDDTTDEDGIAAATAMGGFGVIVGPRRPTVAAYGLDNVDAVYDWLRVGN